MLMWQRIIAILLLLLSILFLPFYISIILTALMMLYFSIFWESVTLFLLSDLLFGVKTEKFFGINFASFIVSVIVLLVLEVIKKKLRISRTEL